MQQFYTPFSRRLLHMLLSTGVSVTLTLVCACCHHVGIQLRVPAATWWSVAGGAAIIRTLRVGGLMHMFTDA